MLFVLTHEVVFKSFFLFAPCCLSLPITYKADTFSKVFPETAIREISLQSLKGFPFPVKFHTFSSFQSKLTKKISTLTSLLATNFDAVNL